MGPNNANGTAFLFFPLRGQMAIFKDGVGFPVDQTGDGGDSAMRAGMLEQFHPSRQLYVGYEVASGTLTRHPFQKPWNNPKNMTRDQLIPRLAGLWAMGQNDVCRRVFWFYFKRGFVGQNTQRDWPGSTKFPWPQVVTENGRDYEFRYFDGPDLFTPDHILHLILCARLWFFYWFYPIGTAWFILSLLFNSKSSHREHNQIISMCNVHGAWAMDLFKKLIPTYKEDLLEYWGCRGEIEYAEKIILAIDSM